MQFGIVVHASHLKLNVMWYKETFDLIILLSWLSFSIFCRFSLSDTFEVLFESLPLDSCSPSNFHSMNSQEASCSKFNDEILRTA